MFGLRNVKSIFQAVGLLLLRSDNWLTASIQMPPLNLHNITVTWIYIPLGIFIALFACLGVDALIRLSSVSFPASVACMILLFCMLLLSQLVLGDRLTRKITGVLDVPVSETLHGDFFSNRKLNT
jgi:purine-cytosine permease-like protein